ncbi:MAG: translation elongation factor Ts [Candidatus Omnitrophota bacterium]
MIKAEEVKKLRESTGAGFMDCKEALTKSGGDFDKAVIVLKEKGLKIALNKSSRVANAGLICSYIHHDGRIGVLTEVNCETDFVARTDDFQRFAKDIALQVASTRPKYVKREDAPADLSEDEIKQLCLLEQPFVKDASVLIKDYLTQIIAKIGENIVIRRFTRYQLGYTE